MFIKISKTLDKYYFEIGDNNTDIPASFLSSTTDHCLISDIPEAFPTFVEAHHYATEIVDKNPTIVLAKKLYFYSKSMEESGIDETHSAVNDKILECYGDQLSLIEKRFNEFENDMKLGEYKTEEKQQIWQTLKEEISKITDGIEKITSESDFSDDETEQLNNVYFGLTKITEKIDKISPPKDIGDELPQAPTEPMPAEMPPGMPVGASNKNKMVRVSQELELSVQQLGMQERALKVAEEHNVEVSPDGNLVLYHGTKEGRSPKIGDNWKIGSYFTSDIKVAEQFANQGFGGKVKIMKVEVPPHVVFPSGDGTYYTLNEEIPVKPHNLKLNASQILKAFGESAVLAINKLHPLSYIKSIYKDNETDDYSIIIAERDKNVVGLKFSNNLLLNEIIPLQKESYRKIYASDFLDKYWIPITYSVGHFVIGSSVIVPNYNISHKKIYGFDKNGKTIVATINIENKDKGLGINRSWWIKIAQDNKKKISDFNQEELINAEVVCTDKKLKTYYSHSGKVLSVIPRDDYIDLVVDFRRGLDKLVLRDDQVDIVKLLN